MVDILLFHFISVDLAQQLRYTVHCGHTQGKKADIEPVSLVLS